MTNERELRLFAAIEPPQEIIARIEQIQLQLKKLISGAVRWVRPKDIHLTIKFFGGVAPDRLAEIEAGLKEVSRETPGMNLQLTTLGVFPRINRPRVIWLGIGGDVGPLAELQQRLEGRFQSLGFASEGRDFHPHLTLARIKPPDMLSGLTQALDKGNIVVAPGFTATELALIKSDLTPQGPLYTKLNAYNFAGGERG